MGKTKKVTEPINSEGPSATPPRVTLCDEEFIALLEAEPGLAIKLREALAGGRWMVTIHQKIKDAPPDDIATFEIHKDFPIVDVAGSMQSICKAVLAEGQAELTRQQGRTMDSRNWR